MLLCDTITIRVGLYSDSVAKVILFVHEITREPFEMSS